MTAHMAATPRLWGATCSLRRRSEVRSPRGSVQGSTEVLGRPDIDVVHVATPPHWHALMSVAAAEAGKDVWCEKPLTRTIAEGRSLVQAVERNGRVLRVNTWFRFEERFYGFGTDVKPVKKAVQGGLLGWPAIATWGFRYQTSISWNNSHCLNCHR